VHRGRFDRAQPVGHITVEQLRGNLHGLDVADAGQDDLVHFLFQGETAGRGHGRDLRGQVGGGQLNKQGSGFTRPRPSSMLREIAFCSPSGPLPKYSRVRPGCALTLPFGYRTNHRPSVVWWTLIFR